MLHRFARAGCVVSGACALLALPCLAAGQGAPPCVTQPGVWTLSFSDEFDAPAVDTSKWRIEDAFLNKNNELQYYAPDEVYTESGSLVLRSRQRLYAGRQYTSGAVDTRGTFAQTYGRFEARMRLPFGQGIWPAFWLLPADGAWPTEIDIMELLGHQPTVVHMTNHWGIWPGVSSIGGSFTGPNFSSDYHTFAVEWTPGRLEYFVDGVSRYVSTSGVPSRPHYIILNTAVGGNWPGNPDATTQFPQNSRIDYVRVYTRHDLLDSPHDNALQNRGFEETIAIASSMPRLPMWTTFGNTFRETITPRNGSIVAKVFGNFTGSFNASGLHQTLQARPGQSWTASAHARHNTGDLLAGGNAALVRLEFVDAGGAVLSSSQSTILTAASTPNAYLSGSTTATAPVGTTGARIVLLVNQPSLAAGAALFDDALLTLNSSPPLCRADHNRDGYVTVQDIYDFLFAWNGGCLASDFSGDNQVLVQDLYDFLSAWNTGCF